MSLRIGKICDVTGLCDFLGRWDWDKLFGNCTDVEDFAMIFYDLMSSAIAVYVPVKKVKNKFSMMLPRALRKLRSKKKLLWKNRHKNVNGCELFNACQKAFSRKMKYYVEKLEKRVLHEGT